MKRMSSLAYHFGVKLRFYPSSKQKKIIKLNYDAQRFVYNSYVGRNRSSYHAKRYLAVKQSHAMPFAFSAFNHYEKKLAEAVVANNELLAKPKNIRDAYSFLQVKDIDSWSDMTSRCVFCEKSEFHDQSCDSCSKLSDSFESHWQERDYQFL